MDTAIDILGITGVQRRLEFFRYEMGDDPSRWQRCKNLFHAEKYFLLTNLVLLGITAAAGAHREEDLPQRHSVDLGRSDTGADRSAVPVVVAYPGVGLPSGVRRVLRSDEEAWAA